MKFSEISWKPILLFAILAVIFAAVDVGLYAAMIKGFVPVEVWSAFYFVVLAIIAVLCYWYSSKKASFTSLLAGGFIFGAIFSTVYFLLFPLLPLQNNGYPEPSGFVAGAVIDGVFAIIAALIGIVVYKLLHRKSSAQASS